jgi:hypothetical protein
MQVGELGHSRRSSLARPARAIQRKRIHSLSTSRVAATLLVVAAVGACSSETALPASGKFVLASTLPTSTIELDPNAQTTLTFLLT